MIGATRPRSYHKGGTRPQIDVSTGVFPLKMTLSLLAESHDPDRRDSLHASLVTQLSTLKRVHQASKYT